MRLWSPGSRYTHGVSEQCKPKKCKLECKRNCPVVRMGAWGSSATSGSLHSLPLRILPLAPQQARCALRSRRRPKSPSFLRRSVPHRTPPSEFARLSRHHSPLPSPSTTAVHRLWYLREAMPVRGHPDHQPAEGETLSIRAVHCRLVQHRSPPPMYRHRTCPPTQPIATASTPSSFTGESLPPRATLGRDCASPTTPPLNHPLVVFPRPQPPDASPGSGAGPCRHERHWQVDRLAGESRAARGPPSRAPPPPP